MMILATMLALGTKASGQTTACAAATPGAHGSDAPVLRTGGLPSELLGTRENANEGPYPNPGGAHRSPDDSDVAGAPARPLPCREAYPLYYGVIRSISQWHIHLTDGRAADLHDYTVIQPTGGTLRKGMRIAIHGFFESGHAISRPTLDAREIVIVNGDGRDR